MLVRIDVRENKLITLLENMLLEKSLKIEIQKEQLTIGDIILEHKDNKLVIERKSVNDLAYSISDGRYMEQSFRASLLFRPSVTLSTFISNS